MPRRFASRNGSNVTQSTYTNGLGFAGGIGGLISQTAAGVTSWYHYVHNGATNVSHLTDSLGAVVQSYHFEAFGNITAESGTIINTRQFQTKEKNAKSKLVYFGQRWYNPAIGRWITPDPLGMVDGPNLYAYLDSVGELISETNLYAYTSNNPINRTDPLGLYWGEDQINWWNYESALPGPYGQPMSEWGSNGPTGWGDPMKYTEGSCGWEKQGERIAVGTVAGATAIAIAADYAGIEIGRQGNNIFRILSKRFKWGYRLDKAHHGKPWGHPHWWTW